jgi:hypothetical protein
MKTRLNILAKKIKSDGFLVTLKWFLVTRVRRFRIFPQRKVIWCRDLTEAEDEDFELPPNITITRFRSRDQMDKEDLKVLIENVTDLMGTIASKMIDSRFEKGAVLWLIKEDGHLAGYRWTIENDPLYHTYVPLTEKDVHLLDNELFEGFRGGPLNQLFSKSYRITLKREGFKRAFSETHFWNKRAIKAVLKGGGCQIGIARKFHLFGRTIVIWSDMYNKGKKIRVP